MKLGFKILFIIINIAYVYWFDIYTYITGYQKSFAVRNLETTHELSGIALSMIFWIYGYSRVKDRLRIKYPFLFKHGHHH